MGGLRTLARRPRRRALAAAAASAALALSASACGSDESSSAEETAAGYPVRIVTSEFQRRQRLGETALMRIGIRNTGHKTIPALTVTITGSEGDERNSALPFGYRDPQPGLAQPDRPVWALAAGYPKVNGSSERAGAETASAKTFDFGPLKAGDTTEAVWKLSAVRTGDYKLDYEIGAGLGGKAKAELAPGSRAEGFFVVRIRDVPPDTVVTDSGEVVPAPEDPTEANR